MSDELKACPFCGSSNTTLDYYEISCPQELGTIVICNDCGASAKSIVDWNARPIEDALRAQLATRDALIERLVEAGRLLCDYAILVSVDHPIGDGQMAINDKAAWEALVAEYRASKDGGGE